jgi:heme-degrading monooxygenase HmoA
MAETAEPLIVIDVWVVSEGSQEEFMQALVGLFERLRTLEGFLDGQILKGVDRTVFVTYATMRSARERDAAFVDREVRATMRSIGGIARPSPHSYTVARRFTPAPSAQSGD